MFTIPNEIIINSNAGQLEVGGSKVRFAALTEVGAAADENTAHSFVIDGGVSFKKDQVVAIYKTGYRDPEFAKASISLTGVTLDAAKVYRLTFWISEIGRSTALVQNAYMKKTRPVVAEVSGVATAAAAAEALEKALGKDQALAERVKVTGVKSGSTYTGVIEVEAKDPYVRFARHYGDILALGEKALGFAEVDVDSFGYEGDATDLVPASGLVTEVGSEGAGTVEQLIKNLRVPTAATADPFHGDHGGMPVPGGKYDQYLITIKSTRPVGLATGAFAQTAEARMDYVVYVKNDLTAWGTELAKMGEIKLAGVPVSAGVPTGSIPAPAEITSGKKVRGTVVESSGEVVEGEEITGTKVG